MHGVRVVTINMLEIVSLKTNFLIFFSMEKHLSISLSLPSCMVRVSRCSNDLSFILSSIQLDFAEWIDCDFQSLGLSISIHLCVCAFKVVITKSHTSAIVARNTKTKPHNHFINRVDRLTSANGNLWLNTKRSLEYIMYTCGPIKH